MLWSNNTTKYFNNLNQIYLRSAKEAKIKRPQNGWGTVFAFVPGMNHKRIISLKEIILLRHATSDSESVLRVGQKGDAFVLLSRPLVGDTPVGLRAPALLLTASCGPQTL